MPPPELAHSGSLGSPLNRVLQKETKITPERRWAKDLIEQIPYEYLGITTEFIKKFPPEQAEEAAKIFFEIIKETFAGVARVFLVSVLRQFVQTSVRTPFTRAYWRFGYLRDQFTGL